jgi:FRG domain
VLNGDYEASEFWRTVSCEDLRVFHGKLAILRKYWPFSRLLYRGHRDATWYLRSTWERKFRAKDPQKAGLYEVYKLQDPKRQLFRNHLSWFRAEVKRQSPTSPALAEVARQNDNILAALGRHHGLYTPLLDWTTDPDVALYFAFFHEEREDGGSVVIWALSLEEHLFDNGYFSWGEWTHSSFSVRQKAQSGVFTWLSDDIFSDLANYLVNHHHRGKYPRLTKFVMPWSEAPAVDRYLAAQRISREKLFPKTRPSDGLAQLDDIAQECNLKLCSS